MNAAELKIGQKCFTTKLRIHNLDIEKCSFPIEKYIEKCNFDVGFILKSVI